MSPRRSAADAQRTRARIVRAAIDEASRVGLEGLTVGSLAGQLGMSKAGLVGPFGSRERLLETALEHAGAIFREEVLAPTASMPAGRERLATVIARWIDYLARCPFPGGCFVSAVSPELDGRPGPLRDRLREMVTSWREVLVAEIVAARAGEPGPHRPPQEVAGTLVGLSMAVNQEIQLLDDPTAPARGLAAMRHAAGLDP